MEPDRLATEAAGRTAYIAREPGGEEFSAYVVDVESDEVVHEGGPWLEVDEALRWANSRASRVQLVYGRSGESVFSAGAVAIPGIPSWPPDAETKTAIDADLRRWLLAPPAPAPPSQLGAAEPEIRRTASRD